MFWTCAFSCQLSLFIANEPPFLLCCVVCSCLSCLEATRTYLSNCLITRISSFILGRSQALSSLHSAKPHLFCLSVAHRLVGVCLAVVEEYVSTDAPLPVFSLEPGSGIAVRKVGCRWLGGVGDSALIFLCLLSGLWSISAIKRGDSLHSYLSSSVC